MITPDKNDPMYTHAALHEPSTPNSRHYWLMAELETRFPDDQPFSSEPAEARMIKRIDLVLKRLPRE